MHFLLHYKKIIYVKKAAEVYFSLRPAKASDNLHYNEHYYFTVAFNIGPYLYQYTHRLSEYTTPSFYPRPRWGYPPLSHLTITHTDTLSAGLHL